MIERREIWPRGAPTPPAPDSGARRRTGDRPRSPPRELQQILQRVRVEGPGAAQDDVLCAGAEEIGDPVEEGRVDRAGALDGLRVAADLQAPVGQDLVLGQPILDRRKRTMSACCVVSLSVTFSPPPPNHDRHAADGRRHQLRKPRLDPGSARSGSRKREGAVPSSKPYSWWSRSNPLAPMRSETGVRRFRLRSPPARGMQAKWLPGGPRKRRSVSASPVDEIEERRTREITA